MFDGKGLTWTFQLIFLSCLSHGWIGYVVIQDSESANNLRKSMLTGCELVCILNLEAMLGDCKFDVVG